MDYPKGPCSQGADRFNIDRRVLMAYKGAKISLSGGLIFTVTGVCATADSASRNKLA